MTRISLRLRLLAAWAIFIALTLQIVGIGLRLLYERSITARTTNELAADLRQLRRGMEVAPDGTVSIVREPTDPQFDIVFGGRYWQVDDASGATLARSRSLNEARLNLPKGVVAGEGLQPVRIIGPEDQKLYGVVRAHALPRQDDGEKRLLTILTAVDSAEIEEDTGKFAADLFSSLAGLAAILLLGAWAHVTIGLSPLETLRARVAEVRGGKADRIEGEYPDEVMPLVLETNALLAAQDKAFSVARERAGNLAHGLNTPLAVMAAKSRELKRKGEDGVANDIDQQIETMRRHVERELARARARGRVAARQHQIDGTELARTIVQTIDSLPREVPIDWIDELPDRLPLNVDRDDFNNIAGNLLENAHKWAKSSVRIKARKTNDGTEFVVEDDGPGVPEEHYDRVLQRGGRAETTVSGSGLGLAIVNDLVELYRGSLSLAQSPLGGLEVRIVFPD